jgi:hypothetical protein
VGIDCEKIRDKAKYSPPNSTHSGDVLRSTRRGSKGHPLLNSGPGRTIHLQPGISMPGNMDRMNYPRPEWTVYLSKNAMKR